MTTPINLDQIRRAWTQRYGATQARRMMAGARGAAYDASSGLAFGSRRARDQDPDDDSQSDPRMNAIKVFLKNRLQPEDWDRLQQMMQALSGRGSEEDPDHVQDPMPDDPTKDDPPSFSGRPRAGGGQDPMGRREGEDRSRYAQDARGSSYFDMFPANAKVGTNNYGR